VTEHDESILKHKLLDACKQFVERQITTATTAMNDAQRSANEEGKSSAGDKYETGRAMMQIERDKAASQLEEALKLKRMIDQIRPEVQPEKVLLGSVVITLLFNIFIAIGAGKIKVGGEEFLVVAPQSPLGKTLLGKQAGDEFLFNKQPNAIVKIY
jgi:transcription elongation GreA/GreB family factor